jgi:uncharacterized membrane protein
VAIVASCEYENAGIKPDGHVVSYSTDITPIIMSKCSFSGCHMEGATIGNFLDFTDLKARIDNGKFRMMVFDLRKMPPALVSPLTNDELSVLKRWIDQGAIKN